MWSQLCGSPPVPPSLCLILSRSKYSSSSLKEDIFNLGLQDLIDSHQKKIEYEPLLNQMPNVQRSKYPQERNSRNSK